jgi:uncharacterized protein (TIGR02996 family)
VTDTRAALEAAVRDDPDDLAAWHALADLLLEAGDPRGEFMRVQLALEDPALDRAARRVLRNREDDLLDEYGREWVGKTLAKLLVGAQQYGLSRHREVGFRRGVFADLKHVTLSDKLSDALARAKTTGWLQTLEVRLPRTEVDLARLAAAPFVPRLRRFALADQQDRVHAPQHRNLAALLAKAARLERLHIAGYDEELAAVFELPFPHLAELTVTDARRVRLAPLAANPTLGRLRRLTVGFPWVGQPPVLHLADLAALCRSPHLGGLSILEFQQSDAGDAGCAALADSGLLFRLNRLSLANGTVTAAGARALADALRSRPHRLASLDLSGNPVSSAAVPHDLGVAVTTSPGPAMPSFPSRPAEDAAELYDEIME